MPVKTLHDLQSNSTYKKLERLQAKLDLNDPVLTGMSMTRSPQHILAFFIAWKLTQLQSKATVVDQLNMNTTEHFNVQELDEFVDGIQWQEFFNDLVRIFFNDLSCLQLMLPQNTYQHIRNNAGNDLLFKLLLDNRLLEIPRSSNSLIINTKVTQVTRWHMEFENASLPNTEVEAWYVPSDGFELSNDFQNELSALETEYSTKSVKTLKKNFGAFAVTAYEGEVSKNNYVKYRLYIAKPPIGKDAYSIFVDSTDLNAGIYNAFLGTYLVGMKNSVENLLVKLEGKAYFDKYVAAARQIQRVTTMCGPDFGQKKEEEIVRRVLFNIYVTDVYALFKHIKVGVNFSGRKHPEDVGYSKLMEIYLREYNRSVCFPIAIGSRPYSILDIVPGCSPRQELQKIPETKYIRDVGTFSQSFPLKPSCDRTQQLQETKRIRDVGTFFRSFPLTPLDGVSLSDDDQPIPQFHEL